MRKDKYLTTLIIILVCSITFVFLYILILIDIPEFFIKAYEIGILINGLALSIISASIFYFIIDFFPKKLRKKKILKIIEVHKIRMEYSFIVILKNLNYLEGEEVITVENANKEKLREVMTRTPSDFLTDENVMDRHGLNISELILSRECLINEQIEELQKQTEFLSPELYKELTALKMRDFSKITRGLISTLQQINQPFPNLRLLTDEFYKTILNMKKIKQLWLEQ